VGLQEAVGHALRHGGATDVKAVFSFRRDGLVILVRDNGCGVNPATVESSGHLGLRSMRERAERPGGTMKITSEIGAGTIVVARLPYSSQNESSKLKR
jgi:signal transduction histidine kinase